MTIKPALKGLFTAIAMAAVIIAIYYAGENAGRQWQFLVYILYALGIAWTLFAHRRSTQFTGTFGSLFSQGFRCFIIVTLFMAIFYAAFNYTKPEFRERSAIAFREELIKDKNVLPNKVEEEVETFKKQYVLKLVSGAIFGYLIIGVGVTAVTSLLLTRRN